MMHALKSIKQQVFPYIPHYIVAGAFLGCGLAIIKSAHIMTGGFPGLSMIFSSKTDLSVGTVLLMLNLPLLWFGYYVKSFFYIVRILFCMVLVSIWTDAIIYMMGDIVSQMYTGLSAILSGVFVGVGAYMFVSNEGNPGGMMIFNHWLSEKINVKLGTVVMSVDALVLLYGLTVYLSPVQFIYSITSVVSTSVILNILKK